MWIYKAYDTDGKPIAEDQSIEKLIEKLLKEFKTLKGFEIKREKTKAFT